MTARHDTENPTDGRYHQQTLTGDIQTPDTFETQQDSRAPTIGLAQVLEQHDPDTDLATIAARINRLQAEGLL